MRLWPYIFTRSFRDLYNPADPAHNRGTFIGIMELLGHDETVQTVLNDVKKATKLVKKVSATMMGKEIQNEIIRW